MIKANREAEQSVIGAILIKPYEIMPECVELLGEDDFLTPECRTVYSYCTGYFVDGKPIDFVILGEQLGKEYVAFLSQCVEMVPSTKNWRAYAEIIKRTAMRSRAWEKSMALMAELEGGEDLGECQDIAAAIAGELAPSDDRDTFSASEGFYHFYTSLQKPPEYIQTGIAKLDSYLYIERGDYIVIGARPSVGKTAITLQIMRAMAKKHKVVYFSLETNALKLFSRMVSSVTGIPLSRIKSRDMDFGAVAKSEHDFKALDFHVVNAAGMGVPEIRAKAIQLGAEVIIVDYIGLVKSPGKTPYERTTNASIAFHILAQTAGITVIAISQLSREGKGKPDMTHLRESGQIEQDADAILMLHAPDGNENPMREIGVVKNKEGGLGMVRMKFEGATQRFYELEERYG